MGEHLNTLVKLPVDDAETSIKMMVASVDESDESFIIKGEGVIQNSFCDDMTLVLDKRTGTFFVHGFAERNSELSKWLMMLMNKNWRDVYEKHRAFLQARGLLRDL